jgi:uncharacterized membrane protein YeaQ/YmgE (transglycosylase-associated protein family)
MAEAMTRKLAYNLTVTVLCYFLGKQLMPDYSGGWFFSCAAGIFIALVDGLENRERKKTDDNLS